MGHRLPPPTSEDLRFYDAAVTAYEEMPVHKQAHSGHTIDVIGVNAGMGRIIDMCGAMV